MKTVAIVQARMGSLRLPGKVMATIVGVPLIEVLLARLQKSNSLDQIVLATSDKPENEPLVAHVKHWDTNAGLEVKKTFWSVLSRPPKCVALM